MTTRLRGGRVATGPLTTVRTDLSIQDGRFKPANGFADKQLDLSGHLLLPGLINAHDHLEFNLFPRLGTRIYSNAGEWAADVYRPDHSPVREQRGIPKPVRLRWGAIKNLLSGATTVAHHNPYDATVFEDHFAVRVVKHFGWAHSLEFSADLRDSFEQSPEEYPFVVHAGEGTDASARSEIQRLDDLGILGPRTVLVHATAAGPNEIALLLARRCAIVWCPTSNLATYGESLSQQALRSGVPIALGTDSGISAQTDLLDEIRLARHQFGLSCEEIYDMVTSRAAVIFRLRDGEGTIQEGGVADLIAVRDEGQTPAEAIFDLRPRMIMVGGEINLACCPIEDKLSYPVSVAGRGKWFVDANVPELVRAAAVSIGDEFHLAGKRITT